MVGKPPVLVGKPPVLVGKPPVRRSTIGTDRTVSPGGTTPIVQSNPLKVGPDGKIPVKPKPVVQTLYSMNNGRLTPIKPIANAVPPKPLDPTKIPIANAVPPKPLDPIKPTLVSVIARPKPWVPKPVITPSAVKPIGKPLIDSTKPGSKGPLPLSGLATTSKPGLKMVPPIDKKHKEDAAKNPIFAGVDGMDTGIKKPALKTPSDYDGDRVREVPRRTSWERATGANGPYLRPLTPEEKEKKARESNEIAQKAYDEKVNTARDGIRSGLVSVQIGESLTPSQVNSFRNVLNNPKTDPATVDQITRILIRNNDRERQTAFQNAWTSNIDPNFGPPSGIGPNPDASGGNPNFIPYNNLQIGNNQGTQPNSATFNGNGGGSGASQFLSALPGLLNSVFVPNGGGGGGGGGDGIGGALARAAGLPQEAGVILGNIAGGGYETMELPQSVTETQNYVRRNPNPLRESGSDTDNPTEGENSTEGENLLTASDVLEQGVPVNSSRYLKLNNNTDKVAKFYFQLKFDKENGDEWTSTKLGNIEEAFLVTLLPGESQVILQSDGSTPLLIQKARIWATTDNQKYGKFQNRDLDLMLGVNTRLQAQTLSYFH